MGSAISFFASLDRRRKPLPHFPNTLSFSGLPPSLVFLPNASSTSRRLVKKERPSFCVQRGCIAFSVALPSPGEPPPCYLGSHMGILSSPLPSPRFCRFRRKYAVLFYALSFTSRLAPLSLSPTRMSPPPLCPFVFRPASFFFTILTSVSVPFAIDKRDFLS